MTNIETISAKMLNQIMKNNPALYNDLVHGKSIDIRNDAVKPLANVGTTSGKLGGTTAGTSAGTIIT
ncbi:MAG: hypothetical protein EOM06_15225, partial [Sphingobacteriia bacterium]|nr:hypothetical protein [Sphingobacteriia bacterium]